MSTYILQKDLPDAKAGDKFVCLDMVGDVRA